MALDGLTRDDLEATLRAISALVAEFVRLGCPHGCDDPECPWYRRLRALGLEDLSRPGRP
jgi:hypothetical protein